MMGNSESSSQFPPPSNNNDGNNNKKTSYRDQAKKALTEGDNEGSTSSTLKFGVIVAGIALLAFSDDSLDSSASKIGVAFAGTALLAFGVYSFASSSKIGAIVAGIALLAFSDYFLAFSASKIGTAVAGTALLAFGTYSLASSASKTRTVVAGIALLAFGDYSLAFSASKIGAAVAGTALLAFGAYSLASSASSQSDDGDNSQRRATQMENLEFEAAGSRSCQNLRNHISYGDNYISFTKESAAAGGTNEHSALRMIKVMSYNVWSLEIEVFQRDKRMEAIGHLIEEHTPDIIFLQEMTHRIYGIFESCDWWQLYECSVPPEKATTKHFCMQLTKLPVEKFYCKSFDNSVTGRGLCVAAISAGAKTKLIAATCHLKRPDKARKHSKERVSQAKEALSYLNSFPNVVFGGDMNWNESSDGRFPLFGEWQDAWSVLRPGEHGYTYDTKSNPMLKHIGSLQRRLDRFICKLKDFEVKRIEMIGTKAIPGFSLFHNGQRLPILPSDHYGLILTICPKQLMW